FIPLLVGLGSLISAWFVLKGRLVFAGTLFVSILFIGMILLAVSLKGLGFLLASVVFITSTYVASLVYTKKLFTWAPIVSLLVCSLILFVDIYASWERDWISTKETQVTSAIAVVTLIVYIVFVVRQFRHFPLGTKLVFVSLALTILPMGLIGWMGYQSSRIALENTANQSLLSAASQIASRLDAFLLYNLDSLRTEANLSDFREYLAMPSSDRSNSAVKQRVTNMLITLRERDPIFINSYKLLDLQGIDISDTNTSNIGSDHSDLDYFKEPLSTGIPFVSPVMISSTGQGETIYFSAAVRSNSGEIVGVLCAGFNARILQQQLVLQEDLKGNYAYGLLVDENSIIRADSLEPGLVHKSIIPLDEARLAELRSRRLVPTGIPVKNLVADLPFLAGGLLKAEQQPSFIANFAGIFQLGKKWTGSPDEPMEQAGTVKMITQPWYVVVVQSRDLLLEPVDRLARGLVVVGMIIALVGGLFAVFIAQYLSNPLSRLTEAASRAAQGDLAARAEVTTDDELGTLAKAFNQMSHQLGILIGTLEQRVADRTKALAASAEVSRRLSTILDVDRLVKTVVDQLRDAFHYYHVHIYLFDDSGENLVMVGGTGEAGQAMLAKGHYLPKGKGLVGRAAENIAPILVEDVSMAPEWLPNPLLPNTRAELAVPIVIGESVFGVLDVQQDSVGALSQLDADLLLSIANQVAVALANARSYAQAQRRANREALISSIAQRIQRTTSAEDALRVTARELGRALGTEMTVRLGVGWEERRVKKG
ncbi:MAG: GAF domain-containing protein, partial [Anaerolineaceae bacterium]|nr:GAF domain-containing protein [Anaerolineaceae bacterium]